jgi:CubicO group peptidase (beta-lactamase class C family)
MTQRRVFFHKALVVAVIGCMGTMLAPGQHKGQSTARTVAAKKDGRAEIDRYAAEWLKESDAPSVAVAYIEHRQVAWTEMYGQQSPGVSATGKTLYNMASLTKPVTAETVLRLASARRLSLDESMSPFWLDPDIQADV